jgi:hypothetical protein
VATSRSRSLFHILSDTVFVPLHRKPFDCRHRWTYSHLASIFRGNTTCSRVDNLGPRLAAACPHSPEFVESHRFVLPQHIYKAHYVWWRRRQHSTLASLNHTLIGVHIRSRTYTFEPDSCISCHSMRYHETRRAYILHHVRQRSVVEVMGGVDP